MFKNTPLTDHFDISGPLKARCKQFHLLRWHITWSVLTAAARWRVIAGKIAAQRRSYPLIRRRRPAAVGWLGLCFASYTSSLTHLAISSFIPSPSPLALLLLSSSLSTLATTSLWLSSSFFCFASIAFCLPPILVIVFNSFFMPAESNIAMLAEPHDHPYMISDRVVGCFVQFWARNTVPIVAPVALHCFVISP